MRTGRKHSIKEHSRITTAVGVDLACESTWTEILAIRGGRGAIAGERVAKLSIDYGSEGLGFESLRLRFTFSDLRRLPGRTPSSNLRFPCTFRLNPQNHLLEIIFRKDPDTSVKLFAVDIAELDAQIEARSN